MGVPWPATLENKVNSGSFTFQIGETVIRTQMDVGPNKTRRRSTKSIDTYQVSLLVKDFNEFTDLYDFYDVDLNGGTLAFDFLDPLTNTTREFKFSSPPSFSSLGAGVFTASMQWETVP